MNQAIILFDGDCGFCNGRVRWISRRDKTRKFRYVALRSEEGQREMREHALPSGLDSMVLVSGGKAMVKSAAALGILERLPGYGWLAWCGRLLPRMLRDAIYDLVARNRHHLGMHDACELPK